MGHWNIDPRTLAAQMTDYAQELVTGNTAMTRQVLEDLAKYKKVVGAAKGSFRKSQDFSGRADLTAAEIIEMAGNPELVMQRFGDSFTWLCENPAQFQTRPGGWPETRYEAKARAQGHEVWYFRWRRL